MHLLCTGFSKNNMYCLHHAGFKKYFSNRVKLFCLTISNVVSYDASIMAAPFMPFEEIKMLLCVFWMFRLEMTLEF